MVGERLVSFPISLFSPTKECFTADHRSIAIFYAIETLKKTAYILQPKLVKNLLWGVLNLEEGNDVLD